MKLRIVKTDGFQPIGKGTILNTATMDGEIDKDLLIYLKEKKQQGKINYISGGNAGTTQYTEERTATPESEDFWIAALHGYPGNTKYIITGVEK